MHALWPQRKDVLLVEENSVVPYLMLTLKFIYIVRNMSGLKMLEDREAGSLLSC